MQKNILISNFALYAILDFTRGELRPFSNFRGPINYAVDLSHLTFMLHLCLSASPSSSSQISFIVKMKKEKKTVPTNAEMLRLSKFRGPDR